MSWRVFDSDENIDASEWIASVKREAAPDKVGMMLLHNGVVRATARDGTPVTGMLLDFDAEKLRAVVESAAEGEGVETIYAWVNRGELAIGDDIMYVLVAGDIRPRVIPALENLVREIKTTVVKEAEHR